MYSTDSPHQLNCNLVRSEATSGTRPFLTHRAKLPSSMFVRTSKLPLTRQCGYKELLCPGCELLNRILAAQCDVKSLTTSKYCQVNRPIHQHFFAFCIAQNQSRITSSYVINCVTKTYCHPRTVPWLLVCCTLLQSELIMWSTCF